MQLTRSWHIVLVAEKISCVIIHYRLVFLCTPDRFVIDTTDRGKDLCAHTHGGTSAAAFNAVGVFALAVEARLVSLSKCFVGAF